MDLDLKLVCDLSINCAFVYAYLKNKAIMANSREITISYYEFVRFGLSGFQMRDILSQLQVSSLILVKLGQSRIIHIALLDIELDHILIKRDDIFRVENIKQTGRGKIPKKTFNIEYDGEIRTITEISKITGIKSNTIYQRLLRGWSIEDAVNRKVSKKKRAVAIK